MIRVCCGRLYPPSSSSLTTITNTTTKSILHTKNQHPRRNVSTLILLRHGESQWNGIEARFTGWCDIPLTVRGRVEAVAAGQLLRSRNFRASRVDVAFTSNLQRASETCELVLASAAGPDQHTWSANRIRHDWRLNERHYGVVQGLYKNDPDLAAKYGTKTVMKWRRSFRGKPPPMDESHEYYEPPPAPLTESLEDCQRRALDCYHDSIAPALFDEKDLPTPPHQRNVIVVAHSNTIRSLMAHFDDVPPDLIPNLHVPNSVPILYRFDAETKAAASMKLEGRAGGSHARWLISAENHLRVRDAIKPGGMLTRALFEAMDSDRNKKLSAEEIEAGVRELMRDTTDDGGLRVDCVVLAIAKKVSRELAATQEEITLEEFERRATIEYEELEQPASGGTIADYGRFW
uniref:Phosphoglycerate mutase n=1 Tax=Ditylum brightwellii TaxID=49249 RepID=A0A6S8RX90_9STRA|mmetsp:Transcript_6072/g.8929  ORF Transcript_6072/g.8929 Transcript_6072/m.8929 type:complete len:404 (-) Transcript_6072:325-1536(-)